MKEEEEEEVFENVAMEIPIIGQGRRLVIWPFDDIEEIPERFAKVSETVQGWVITEDATDDGFPYIHILFRNNTDAALLAGTIAHECLHVLRILHRDTGQNFNLKKGDDEFSAYILQWLVEQCYLKLTNNEEE